MLIERFFMKKGLLASYIDGLTDWQYGENYRTMLRYFFPEFITSFILYSLPFILDSIFIGHLKSTPTYTTLGMTNNLLHFLIKVGEAVSIGTVILAGQFNGIASYKDVGRTIRDAFWMTFFLGFGAAVALYFGAYYIYYWYGVPEHMIVLGVPFLRLRAVGVFFMFMYFAIIGFLRGIKNTQVPMRIFVIGACVFVIVDYVLIFGAFGFPALGLQGSATASVVQYAVMFLLSFLYMLYDSRCRTYGIQLFSVWSDTSYIKQIFKLSWPVALDKATIAVAYIWLGKMIIPMGVCAQATFCAVKDIERFAFLPALAFAQIITFLVSNDYSNQNWVAIKNNIKKVVFLTSCAVFSILLFFWFFLDKIVHFFDRTGEFTPMVTRVFPLLSVLVFFDLLQLILSGALRGAGNVKTVMKVRLFVCLLYFGPMSYLIAHLPIQDEIVKFVMVYGSFYIGNALMSVMYIKRFRGDEWKQPSV